MDQQLSKNCKLARHGHGGGRQPGEVSSPRPAHHLRDPAVQGGRQGDAAPPGHPCQARYHLQESLQTSSGQQGGGGVWTGGE